MNLLIIPNVVRRTRARATHGKLLRHIILSNVNNQIDICYSHYCCLIVGCHRIFGEKNFSSFLLDFPSFSLQNFQDQVWGRNEPDGAGQLDYWHLVYGTHGSRGIGTEWVSRPLNGPI